MNKLVERGFTLIEVMLVVAIIGIVASMAMPVAKKYRTSSVERDYVSDFSDLVTSVRAYYLIHNEWPSDSDPFELPLTLKPYLPARFIGPITTSISAKHRRVFNADPSISTKSYYWDYENWLGVNLGIRMSASVIQDESLASRALELAETFFPSNEVERAYIYCDSIMYIFRESPRSGDNRYY